MRYEIRDNKLRYYGSYSNQDRAVEFAQFHGMDVWDTQSLSYVFMSLIQTLMGRR